MRFRTVISNVALLHKIVRSLHTLARTCVVRLYPDKISFIIPGNEGREGVQVWSQVKIVSSPMASLRKVADPQETLFSGYRIESNSNNEICLEIHLEALLRVLKSCETCIPSALDPQLHRGELSDAEVTLKLNRRQSDNAPIWAFEIRGRSAHDKPVSISHEVKVHILSARRQAELNEPLCPPPDIHLVLPPLGELRSIVSRIGQMANEAKVSANHVSSQDRVTAGFELNKVQEGTLEVSIKSRAVDTTTTWQGLHLPTSTADADASQAPSRDHMFSTTVSIKGLLKFLTSHLIGGTAIACICQRHCLIVYVYIGDVNNAGGVLTFFIPAKNVDPDD